MLKDNAVGRVGKVNYTYLVKPWLSFIKEEKKIAPKLLAILSGRVKNL